MPRKSTIWYWKARDGWYTQKDRKRVLLAKGKENKGEAEKAYHRLMLEEPTVPVADESVAAILDDFLTWTKENRAAKTYKGYFDFCQSFVDQYGSLSVSDLHTGYVTTWLNSKPTWNATTKHGAITALQRGFNWAVKNRGLRFNPIKGMEKPTPLRRTKYVSESEFEERRDWGRVLTYNLTAGWHWLTKLV